jgi:hypothetical protein
MKVQNINWEQWLQQSRNYKELKWEPSVDEHFLDHLLPILSSIPLKRNEHNKIQAFETLNALTGTEVITPNGLMSGEDVRRVLLTLYYLPRGKLVKGSQVHSSRLAALTPLAMYAHKLHNNVNYEEWDKKDKGLHLFLGKALEPLLGIEGSVNLTTPEKLAFRKKALTYLSGAKEGIMASLTAYKCNLHAFKFKKPEDMLDDPEFDGELYSTSAFPQVVIMMVLQTWLAYGGVRKPGIMILDPWNWDEIPKSIDTISPKLDNKEDITWT